MTDAAFLPPPIQYRFERADLWHQTRAMYRPTRTRQVLTLLGSFALMMAGVVYAVGGLPSVSLLAALAMNPIVVSMVVIQVLFALYSHLVSAAIMTARFRHLAIADKQVRLTFEHDALAMDVEGIESRLPWASVVKLIEAPDRVLRAISKYEMLMVPRRAFTDDTAYRAAVQFLREKVPHGPS